MAEDTNIVLQNTDDNLNQIEISPNVLEVIAGIAASQVEGVNKMSSSFTTSVNEILGRKKEHGKGIKVSYENDELDVDVYVYLDYGVSVPKVALDIQQQVEQQLLFMTELQVHEVNVHVQGMVLEKSETTVDPNNPFAKEDGE